MSGKRGQYTAYDRDQVAKWKSAIGASRRRQHNHRGRRDRGVQAVTGPGMVRLPPPQDHPAGQDGEDEQKGTT
jgi:hypothetical protein